MRLLKTLILVVAITIASTAEASVVLGRSTGDHDLTSNLAFHNSATKSSGLQHSALHKRSTHHRNIRVVLHYECMISGERHETFEWSVNYDAERNDVDYVARAHITGFPEEDKDFDDGAYPNTFIGSWFYNDRTGFSAHGFECHYKYRGYFEGEVGWNSVEVVFNDNPNRGRPLPTIVEACSQTEHNPGERCLRWTTVRPCNFVRADVTTPEIP